MREVNGGMQSKKYKLVAEFLEYSNDNTNSEKLRILSVHRRYWGRVINSII